MWITKELGKNFFDVNEETALMSPFKELIESVGKRRASNIMWSIYEMHIFLTTNENDLYRPNF